jgi:hypothetical protein
MENDDLKTENETLKQRVNELETRLKKYTNPTRNKKYYHENKEEIKHKQYAPSIMTPEQRKEYNKRAYQKRKGKNETDKTDENV